MKCTEIKVKMALSKSGLEYVDYSLNPYTGCSHSCIYCYSPYVIKRDPQEFWNNIMVKVNLPLILQREVKQVRGNIFIGSVTDPYQPCENDYAITRRSLEILIKNKIKFTILTKSNLIVRDLDLLNNYEHAEVGFTLNTMDEDLKSILEPRSPEPEKILDAISRVKVKKYVMIAPLFSTIENELENMFDIFSQLGVNYVLMDKFRYRMGMPESLKKYFYKNEERIKILALKLSLEKKLPVYFSF